MNHLTVPRAISVASTLTLLMTLSTLTHAEEPPQVRWFRTFGGPYMEDARMLTMDGAGGCLAAGTTEAEDTTSSRLYIVHVDGLGRILWEQAYIYGHIAKAKDIHLLPEYGYIVTGYRQDDDGTGMDGLVMLLDPTGEVIWDYIFEGEQDDVAWRARPVGDGFIVIGITESNPLARKDSFIAKLSWGGELMWMRQHGTLAADRTTAMVVLPNNEGYLLAGMTRATENLEDDGWLLCLNTEGDSLWARQYGGERTDEFYWIEPLPQGGFILCGGTKSNHDREDYDTWVVAVDDQGNETGTFAGGTTTGDDWAQMVQVVDDGYVFVGLGHRREHGHQVSILKLDTELNLVYADDRGNEYIDKAFAIRAHPEGGFFIAGKATRPGQEWPDLFIARTRRPPRVPALPVQTQ